MLSRNLIPALTGAFVRGGGLLLAAYATGAAENVMLTGMPDYTWYAGCFGTASGNLMGYWDRHGFPNFYTGPTAGGIAPLNSNGVNEGIRSLWASKAGFDGRSPERFGHIDDYWQFYLNDEINSYESTDPDPYLVAGRAEHPPDCLGDFIGASQNKWTNLNGECDGNIDAFSVTYWDTKGGRRVNYVPPPQGKVPVRDIPSGLREWTRSRGNDANVFSQLTDFNPNVPAGNGFTFENMKAEIDAGYPVMLFLQEFHQTSRSLPGMPRANPKVHGMVAYGYFTTDSGLKFVRYKTSWGSSGDYTMRNWTAAIWEALLPLRGVIGYHPLPRITGVQRANNAITVKWDGPSSVLTNFVTQTSIKLHRYVVEKSESLDNPTFSPVSEPTAEHETTLANCCNDTAFFRVRLLPPP